MFSKDLFKMKKELRVKYVVKVFFSIGLGGCYRFVTNMCEGFVRLK